MQLLRYIFTWDGILYDLAGVQAQATISVTPGYQPRKAIKAQFSDGIEEETMQVLFDEVRFTGDTIEDILYLFKEEDSLDVLKIDTKDGEYQISFDLTPDAYFINANNGQQQHIDNIQTLYVYDEGQIRKIADKDLAGYWRVLMPKAQVQKLEVA